MKSIETLFSEQCDTLKEKGVTADAIAEAIKNCTSVEQKLSVLKEFDPNPFTRPQRVMRKNGAFVESDAATREQDHIVGLMRSGGLTFSEASCLTTGDVVKAGTPNPDFVKNSIRESWKAYLPTISQSDLDALVNKGVWAPKE
jgi:hypothetical protein